MIGFDGLTVGMSLIVNDGSPEPIDADSPAWRVWKSHNFVGTVTAVSTDAADVEAIDGPTWTIRRDAGHTLEPVTLGEGVDLDLVLAKFALRQKVKARRDAIEREGAATPYGTVDTDPDSQRKISGASTMALALGAAFTMDWRMADNSIVTLDASQMIELGVAVAQRIAACQANKNAIDAAIDAAADQAALEAIDIESGWPA